MNGTVINQKYLIIPWLNTKDSKVKTKIKKKDAWVRQANVLRKNISRSWRGADAVQEIRDQRTKKY